MRVTRPPEKVTFSREKMTFSREKVVFTILKVTLFGEKVVFTILKVTSLTLNYTIICGAIGLPADSKTYCIYPIVWMCGIILVPLQA